MISTSVPPMSFHELEDLRLFLTELKDHQTESLQRYHDSATNGFYHRYDDHTAGEYSKSSTATCVLSLIATGSWQHGDWNSRTVSLATAMLHTEWRSADLPTNNVFTVAFMLEAIAALLEAAGAGGSECAQKPENQVRIAQAENILLAGITIEGRHTGSVSLEGYPPSAFLTQLVVRVLLKRHRLDDNLRRLVADWAWREIDHQLALYIANSKTADVYQISYAISLVAALADPGRLNPDRNLILGAALSNVFDRQLPDGSWPRSRPLFHYPRVGSAYCYEYEMLTQLLPQRSLDERLQQYLPNISVCARLLRHTAFDIGDGRMGWSSGHHPQFEGPESWSTASVFHFVHVLDRLVAECIRRAVFEYVGASYSPPASAARIEGEFARDLVDCPLFVEKTERSLRDTLFAQFVQPIATSAQAVESGGSLPKAVPMSAILFGPPGTSKTELAGWIAAYLKWPMLSIDPSHFVRDGLDRVQAEADKIFGMLAASERVVVLLDEFDEMVRDRHQASELLSRFLTTAMLPKLVAINSNRKIVFIVATNYIDQFDLAISRSGRFDMLLQVLPPSVDAKFGRWSAIRDRVDRLNADGVATEEIREKIGDLTYDECRSLEQALSDDDVGVRFVQMVDDRFVRCTLSSQYADGKTWGDACREQRSKVRLPAS